MAGQKAGHWAVHLAERKAASSENSKVVRLAVGRVAPWVVQKADKMVACLVDVSAATMVGN